MTGRLTMGGKQDYAREYVRLSLLGVNKINSMTECSKVLPAMRTTFKNADQALIDEWLNSTEVNAAVADAVNEGDNLAPYKDVIDKLKKKNKKKTGKRFDV